MEKLIRIRANYRGQVTRFQNFVQSIQPDAVDLNLLKARHDNFVLLQDKFEDVQTQIELASTDGKELDFEKERDSFDEEFYKAEAAFRTLMDNFSLESRNSSLAERQNHDVPVKLPNIQLPQFDGTLTNYRSFKNTFDSLISANMQLTGVQRFIYLKSSVLGSAAELIAPLSITEENYEVALELLEDRYNNIRSITQAHLKILFEQECCKLKTVSTLRRLIDHTTNNVAALGALGEPVDKWDSILVYLILSKLDTETRELFEMDFKCNRMPTFKELMKFLTTRCNSCESLKFEPNKPKGLRSLNATVSGVSTGKVCPLCKVEHKIFKCPQFLSLTPQTRFEKVKSFNLCIKCLGSGHQSKNCSFRSCSRCNKSHNTLIHFEPPSTATESETRNNNNNVPASEGAVLNSISSSSSVLLYTAIIRIKDRFGRFHLVRGVVDPGSQVNVITERVVKRLNLKTRLGNGNIDGFGRSSNPVSKFVDILAFSNHGEFSTPFQAFVYSEITDNLPRNSFEANECFSNLWLADPTYNTSGEVDFLLSNAVYTRILKGGVVSTVDRKLKAINTEFGYLIGGLNQSIKKFPASVALSVVFGDQSTSDQLEKFWVIEDIPDSRSQSGNDICERHFVETTIRGLSGQFSVQLPFSKNSFDFSFSREFASNRFRLLERKFRKRPDFKKLYVEFINEYKNLSHMSLVSPERMGDAMAYYIPHHGVINSNSIVPKLRVVFDGSSCPNNTTSLNSVLFSGPKLQNDIVAILIRFRFYRYAFVTDITKMFRMIEVQECHRKYQRIFWRENETDPIKEYELNTVTYGLKSSPYHAIRCLQQLAEESEREYSVASKILKHDSFVDDIVSGFNSIEEGHLHLLQLVRILRSGNFELHKWNSNSVELIKPFAENLSHTSVDILNDVHRVLGILWDPKIDTFSFSCSFDCSLPLTKRVILSQLAGIFDPLGWISPSVVIGKLIMQDIWKLKLDWDDEVPDVVSKDWLRLIKGLNSLKLLTIPRFLGITFDKAIELIGFSDASMKAYGACIYLDTGQMRHLLIAKSRVAPVKRNKTQSEEISIARLELLGALILSKLMKYVLEILPVTNIKTKLFTDSRIVLAWLAKPACNWKPFVANRVIEIQRNFSFDKWSYIPSKDNPADLISRGCYPEELNESLLWRHGPQILPSDSPIEDTDMELKVRSFPVLCLSLKYFCKFSNYRTTLHVFAFVNRFLNNCKFPPQNRRFGPLSVEEISTALTKIVKILQTMYFEKTFDYLKKNKTCSRKDPLWALQPFIDDQGCLRVGGRLKNADVCYFSKHPLILPKSDHFIDLLITHEHRYNEHANVDTLVVLLRQKFWIINARSVVRKVIQRCFRCFRANPRPCSQLMGQLPTDRVTLVRAFLNVGVDYCGPFNVRPTRRRGNSTSKCYVAVFVCFSIKAVHLESVSDLTTESFLAAFRRFIARRGRPESMWSDNATNFVGASREIDKLFELVNSADFSSDVGKFCLDEGIKWNFIPPRSPSFGGLWERSVRSMKSILCKCIGLTVLTIEEFQTIITQVECALNSRPLCQVTECSDNLNILTPGHFLVGAHLKALPSSEMDSCRPLAKRYQICQNLFNQFWEQWSTDYLTSLNKISKKCPDSQSLKVGDIGVILMENTSPLHWPLAKIVKVYPGKDGLVRVVDLKYGQSIVRRGVQKFCRFSNFS